MFAGGRERERDGYFGREGSLMRDPKKGRRGRYRGASVNPLIISPG